jgi:serine/threonine-protein kinase
MERLVGENLEQMIKRKGQLSAERTFRIAKEVLKGLEAAHAKGIVHCDMKPANVFLVRTANKSGAVKLLDFGIFRMMGDLPSPSDLAADQVLGTPHYMAPEQALGQKVDARTDLYSLGAILHECLVGMPPFSGDSITKVFSRILNEKPSEVSTIRPDLPKPLSQLIASMLAKNPLDRPSSATDVLAIITQSRIADHQSRSGKVS